MTTRSLVRTALLVTVLFGAQARLVPYLPGDVPLARAVQALSPGTGWVAPAVATAGEPQKLRPDGHRRARRLAAGRPARGGGGRRRDCRRAAAGRSLEVALRAPAPVA
ncbi:MAG: hypothetical protein R2708_16215 [Vicinamibacterales bacterium]